MAGDGDSRCDLIFNPIKKVQDAAHVKSMDQYRKMYKRSVDDPAGFWGEIAEQFYWKQAPNKEKFLQYNFDQGKGPISIKWMEGAVTNICYNTLDRNVNDRGMGDKVAFYW